MQGSKSPPIIDLEMLEQVDETIDVCTVLKSASLCSCSQVRRVTPIC